MFAINTDGTDFTGTMKFPPRTNNYNNSDGANPEGELVLSGGNLYGTTKGGSNGAGTMFAIGTNGTSFTVIHIFSGSSDGRTPAGMSLSGGTLYGATYGGSSVMMETFIRLSPTARPTPTFIILLPSTWEIRGLNWYCPVTDCMEPQDTGAQMNGTVFAVNTNGSGYIILHSFGAC